MSSLEVHRRGGITHQENAGSATCAHLRIGRCRRRRRGSGRRRQVRRRGGQATCCLPRRLLLPSLRSLSLSLRSSTTIKARGPRQLPSGPSSGVTRPDVASSALAWVVDRSRGSPAGMSSSSSRCSRLTVQARAPASSSRRSASSRSAASSPSTATSVRAGATATTKRAWLRSPRDRGRVGRPAFGAQRPSRMPPRRRRRHRGKPDDARRHDGAGGRRARRSCGWLSLETPITEAVELSGTTISPAVMVRQLLTTPPALPMTRTRRPGRTTRRCGWTGPATR